MQALEEILVRKCKSSVFIETVSADASDERHVPSRTVLCAMVRSGIPLIEFGGFVPVIAIARVVAICRVHG